MSVSRRSFLKTTAAGAAALGLNLFDNPLVKKAFARAIQETPIIWLAAGACSGCSVSLLNSLSPRIEDVLLDQVLPGHHTELAFHPTVMAASGELALEAMHATEERQFLLVVEGSVLTAEDGRCCEVGEKDGQGITALDHLRRLAPKAKAIVAVGACAAYGGVPKANMNPAGAMGVAAFLKQENIPTPVINLPGCSVHPDWFIGTVAALLLGGPQSIELDADGRPKMFFRKLIHDNCPLRGQFDQGKFAQKFGDEGCLYKLGCKGPVTHSNCPEKKWNSGTNWCIDNHHPCQGCTEPAYPFEQSMWIPLPPKTVTPPAAYPPLFTERKQKLDWTPGYAALAGIAGGVLGSRVLGKKGDAQDDKGKD
ncbi:MAG: twin-arginine translocation signal domain-containing protein [Alphaproteobacteria bacterium]|nr:MAG: twin-arginine translocation signal domain-containing protein [Alphaproteobacteria bacterium]